MLAGGLLVAMTGPAPAQDEQSPVQNCLAALKETPDRKFELESAVICEEAVTASLDKPKILTLLAAIYFKFGKPERAGTILEAAVALGDLEAMTGLGLMYFEGKGVQQDFVRALELLQRPAEAGYPHAQYALGRIHEDGLGVTQSEAQALEWYRRAAEQGYEKAVAKVERLESGN